MGALALGSNFNGGEAYGNLRNLFAIGKPVFDVQPDGILDIFDGFFVAVSLAIAPLEGRARNEVPVRVCFGNDRQRNVFHG